MEEKFKGLYCSGFYSRESSHSAYSLYAICLLIWFSFAMLLTPTSLSSLTPSSENQMPTGHLLLTSNITKCTVFPLSNYSSFLSILYQKEITITKLECQSAIFNI